MSQLASSESRINSGFLTDLYRMLIIDIKPVLTWRNEMKFHENGLKFNENYNIPYENMNAIVSR